MKRRTLTVAVVATFATGAALHIASAVLRFGSAAALDLSDVLVDELRRQRAAAELAAR